MRKFRFLLLTALIAFPAVFISCDDEDDADEMVEMLCEDFWFENQRANGIMIRFRESGTLYYYKYYYSESDKKYYITRDTDIADKTHYMLDEKNRILSILPGNYWYYFSITDNQLDLTAEKENTEDNSADVIRMRRLDCDHVVSMDREEFFETFPNYSPK